MDLLPKTKAATGDSSGATNNRVYEDFDPHMEWARDDVNFDTLLVYLPGFLKDKLKIQITSNGKLRLSGERLVGQNKWRRFLKELPLAADCDSNKISAKFEGGILYVKVPKSPNNTIDNMVENNPIVKDHEKSKPNPKTTSTTTPSDQPAPALQLAKKPSNAKEDLNEMPKKDLKTGTNKPDEKRQQDSSADKSKLAAQATSTGDVSGKTMTRFQTYKKMISRGFSSDGVVKSPRALVNIILAVLFIGVLGLYVKNAFKSIGHLNGSDEL